MKFVRAGSFFFALSHFFAMHAEIGSLQAPTIESQKFSASMIDTIQEFYTQLSTLPISELLDLLDEIVDQFEDISTTYELNNQEISWSAWLDKYWWMPPVFVCACCIVILRYKKNAAYL